MNMFKKTLSAVLALLMTVSAFTALLSITTVVYATDVAEEELEEDEKIDILKVVYKTPDAKIAAMKLRFENDNYQLYALPAYGEVAVKDKRTGQVLFSNPYDIASTQGSADTKSELMSQIILEFSTGSKTTTFNSYTEAALREQIVVKNIKNGIRAEYTLGKTETRWLVPQMISAERFEEVLMTPMRANTAELTDSQRNFILQKFENGFYSLKDVNDPTLSERARNEMYDQWPILKKIPAIWVLGDTKDREYNMLEGYIKTYSPDYSFEDLDFDHDQTEYEATATASPMFRMAIEYTLDDTGLTQTLAANSIRFDETSYTLNYIKVNPWFGAGNGTLKGFTFIPDGSGTLTRFEDITNPLNLTGKVYGSDFAYHETDPAHRQTMRLPVYGVVENFYNRTVVPTVVELPESEWYTDQYGYVIKTKTEMVATVTEVDRGYFAILTEGDALAEISTVNGAGSTHVYSSVQTTFYPRPTDQYNLSEAISVGSDEMWTVTSKRKYTGNYTVKYYLLSDKELADEYIAEQTEKAADSATAAEADTDAKFYEATYMGMVNACRDYFEGQGILTRLTAEEVKEDIPLTVEVLGVTLASERILSVPVTVRVPLTTFEDIESMYGLLEQNNIKNVNFKLTGFANGGLYSTVPGKLKWEKKAGGASGFNDLMAYAGEKGIGIYPDFDFEYVGTTKLFDGFSYKQHAVKTMDNRYPRKYYYDPAYQTIRRSYYNPISASVFEYFYEKLAPKLLEFKPTGISVGTLGSDLNSDFDKKDSYNREDSKSLVQKVLAKMNEDFGSVMTTGGNAYTLRYTDYILEVPLDSSQYLKASEAIPFMGMVLHGYVNFAGSALNMAGDIDSEILKCIENGASPYFLLAYRNTDKLKEDYFYKKYYSVNFQIWAEAGLIDYYNTINNALKDVQNSLIVNHEFLKGERVLSAEEIAQREEDERRKEEEEAASQSIEDAKTAEDVTTAPAEDVTTDAEVTAETDEPEDITTAPAETETSAETTGEETTAPEDDDPEDDDPEDDDPLADVNPEDIVNNGKIIRVTYDNGKTFILNYNNYAVRIGEYEIPALGFVSYFTDGGNANE